MVIEFSQNVDVSVCPNPTEGDLSIHMENQFEESQILIFDLQSKLVFQSMTSVEYTILNLKKLEVGLYILELKGLWGRRQQILIKN